MRTVSQELSLIQVNGGTLEYVDKLCYLGVMIGSEVGAEKAFRMRVKCAWRKLRELSPILTARRGSRKLKDKVYRTCVQSVLAYGSKTWAMKAEDIQRLEETERTMNIWRCDVKMNDWKANAELLNRLGIDSVLDVVRRGRLRWFGHVERKEPDDWVSACRKHSC